MVRPLASMARRARRVALSPGWRRAPMRPSASTRISPARTLRGGSIVTTVPPQMASAGGAFLTATVRGAGIGREQQRHVKMRVAGVDPELNGHPLEKGRGSALVGEIGRHIEHQAVAARVE